MSSRDSGGSFSARPVSALGVEQFSSWSTKLYGIAAAAPRPRAELVRAARGLATQALPARAPSDAAAFVIAHDALPASFTLVCWWANGCDLCQRYFRAPLDRPADMDELDTRSIGCVWELAIVSYECDAWVQHVLANPAGADVRAYLGAQLHDPRVPSLSQMARVDSDSRMKGRAMPACDATGT